MDIAGVRLAKLARASTAFNNTQNAIAQSFCTDGDCNDDILNAIVPGHVQEQINNTISQVLNDPSMQNIFDTASGDLNNVGVDTQGLEDMSDSQDVEEAGMNFFDYMMSWFMESSPYQHKCAGHSGQEPWSDG